MMSFPSAVLLLKLLVWLLVLAIMLRLTARALDERSMAPPFEGLAAALLGAVVGAKLGFAANYPIQLWVGPFGDWWRLAAGQSTPGAILGAWLGLAWSARDRVRAGELADLLAAPVLTGLLVLDFGSLLWSLSESGFGAPARLGGIDFGDGVPRHPVMLYDAFCVALLLRAERLLRGSQLAPGLGAAALFASYAGVQFLLGFLKPPYGPVLLVESVYPAVLRLPAPAAGWGWTVDQWLCLGLLSTLGAVLLRGARSPVSKDG